jgi:4-amino-4-deoxy-L-arabinose transferase-like glycosyltransferase
MARLPLLALLDTLRYDAGPPFYYILLRGWRALFGESELALRGLSLGFALATTVLLYTIARRLWDPPTGLWSAGFWVHSPLSTVYAYEARNYTCLALLTVCFFLSLQGHSGRWKAILWAGLTAMLLVYTHNLGWFVVAGGLATHGLLTQDWKARAQTATILPFVAFAYIPWIPILQAQLQNTAMTIGWVQNFWSPTALFQSLLGFLPGGALPSYVGLVSLPFGLQAAFAVLWIGLFVHLGWTTRRSNPKSGLYPALFLGFGLLLPYLYSWLRQPVYLPGRTDFALYPLWCLLTGLAIRNLPSTWRWGVSGVILLACLSVTGMEYTKTVPKSERDIVRYLSREAQPGDVVLCTGLTRPPLEYALQPRGLQFVSYPRSMATHLAHIDEAGYLQELNIAAEATASLEEALQHTQGTVWVAASRRKINEALLGEIKTRWPTLSPIQTERMGLRRLNEPIFLLRITP